MSVLSRLFGRARQTVPKRILLLALLPIGDTLFITPTIRALREQYPAAKIVALVHSTTLPLMRWVPQVDEVLVAPLIADWAGLGVLIGFLRRLRAMRFDVAIDFTSPIYNWISLVCGIPERTAMKFDPLWWIVPGRHRRWRLTHAMRHYYACARELRLPPWEEVEHVASLRLPATQRHTARAWLRARGSQRPLVGIHAGGAGLNGLKRWPAERFAALANRLTEAWGAQILLLGGPEDVALVRDIAARLRQPPLIAAGEVSLLTSIALIEACDLFIGNDSSPLHLAATVGTPYVGIYGPTSAANFHPMPREPWQGSIVLPAPRCCEQSYFVGGEVIWRPRRRCSGVCEALAAIPVAAVFAQADVLLRRRFPQRQPLPARALPSERSALKVGLTLAREHDADEIGDIRQDEDTTPEATHAAAPDQSQQHQMHHHHHRQ